RDGPKASDCCDAVRCECAAGERMRPSAGKTPDGEAIDLERIRDGANVVGDVGNGAAGECFGPAVAGPVVAHESNPSLLGVTHVRPKEEPAHRCAVVDEDDRSAARAFLVEP